MKLAFGGKDIKGNRLGIYLEHGATKKSIKYTIKGKFSNNTNYKEQIVGQLPMQRWKVLELLGIDTDEEGDYNPFYEAEIKKAELKKKKREQKRKKLHNKNKKVKSECVHK